MALSVVQICNIALADIGAALITDLPPGDTGQNAIYCDLFYEPVRDAVLRMHLWNCAMARQSLARLADAPVFGFSYAFSLPQNPYCLRAFRINEEWDCVFRVEGRKLLTDEGTCDLEYIMRITDPNTFDSLLVLTIAKAMAEKLVSRINPSATLKAQMQKELKDLLSEARASDAQEGTPEDLDTSTWLDARLE